MSLLVRSEQNVSVADDAERRVAPRTKTLKRAKVYFNNMNSTFDCLVRNISATGALLALDEAAHLPREFEFRIGEEKTLRPARLVYRRGALAGIHFGDVPDTADGAAQISAEDLQAVLGERSGDGKGIRRLKGERLPAALTRNVRWF